MNRKRETLDLNESLESEAFVDELEEDVKSKKIKRKRDQKSDFKAFQSEMLEKQLQSESVEKQRDRQFFLRFGKMLEQVNNN